MEGLAPPGKLFLLWRSLTHSCFCVSWSRNNQRIDGGRKEAAESLSLKVSSDEDDCLLILKDSMDIFRLIGNIFVVGCGVKLFLMSDTASATEVHHT